MKKKTTKHTPKRKGGAKVRRVTVTFYDTKPRDQLICYFLDRKGVSTSEALHSTLLECALQNARDMAKEVYGLPESSIKYLTPAQLLTILNGEWASENKQASTVVKETTYLPPSMPKQVITRGQHNEEDNDGYGIDDL